MHVLSVVHDPSSLGGGGLFEEVAAERGGRLDRWIVPEGGPPAPPEAYDAIMVFGGVQHPDQDDAYRWLPDEVGFIAGALAARVPLLGVCLGCQLVARAAGAWVGRAAQPEVGWPPVELTEEGAGDPVLAALPPRAAAFQWHYYTFELPAGGVLLASSPAARQAFRLGEATWGIQFHAEVTAEMVEDWLVEGEQELERPIDEVRRETEAFLPDWSRYGRALCERFLDVVERRRS